MVLSQGPTNCSRIFERGTTQGRRWASELVATWRKGRGAAGGGLWLCGPCCSCSSLDWRREVAWTPIIPLLLRELNKTGLGRCNDSLVHHFLAICLLTLTTTIMVAFTFHISTSTQSRPSDPRSLSIPHHLIWLATHLDGLSQWMRISSVHLLRLGDKNGIKYATSASRKVISNAAGTCHKSAPM